MNKKIHLVFLMTFALAFVFSATKPHDYFTWFLEVVPAIIGVLVLVGCYKRFQFSNLVYFLIWLHALVLVIGGHYTYAEVPLFNWFRDVFDLERNYYDRVGHFMQGFVPGLIAREVFIRNTQLKKGAWLFFVCVCVSMTVSSLYELFEWGVAVATGSGADAFLGTQGDVWDTQWDMFCALIGVLSALLSLSRWHNKSLQVHLPKAINT